MGMVKLVLQVNVLANLLARVVPLTNQRQKEQHAIATF